MRALYPNVNALSSGVTARLQEPLIGPMLTFNTAHVSAAFKVKYLINQTTLDALRKLFDSRMVIMDEKANRTSTHPIPAALLQYAAADLIRDGTNMKPFIDIGGNILYAKNNKHTCLLATNTRDVARYLTNMNSTNDSYNEKVYRAVWSGADVFTLYNRNYNETSLGSICFKGAECCRHTAKTLILNHSLYDMTHKQIYDMIRKHKAKQLIAWTFYPPDLWLKDAFKVNHYEPELDFYTYFEQGEMSIMGYKDGSFCYVHNTNNWRLLLEVSYIRGDDFDIVVEVVDRIGFMFKQRFTVVPRKLQRAPLIHSIFFDYMAKYVAVPDLWENTKLGFVDHLNFMYVPDTYYTRVMNLALKALEIKSESIHTYAVAISTQIDISDTVIIHAIKKDPSFIDHLVYSIVFIAIAERIDRSDVFKAFLEEVKNTKPIHINWSPLGVKKLWFKICDRYRACKNERHANKLEYESHLYSKITQRIGPLYFDREADVQKFLVILPGKIGEKIDPYRPADHTSDPEFNDIKYPNFGDHLGYERGYYTDEQAKFNNLVTIPQPIIPEIPRVMPEPLEPPALITASDVELSTDIDFSRAQFTVIKYQSGCAVPNARFEHQFLPFDESEALSRNEKLFKRGLRVSLCSQFPKQKFENGTWWKNSRASQKAEQLLYILNQHHRAKVYDYVFDLGAAPGYASRILSRISRNKIMGYTIDTDDENFMFDEKMGDFYEKLTYMDISKDYMRVIDDANALGRCSILIYSDIGPTENVSKCTQAILEIIKQLKCDFIVKTFTECSGINTNLASLSYDLAIVKPVHSVDVNSEFYMIGRFSTLGKNEEFYAQVTNAIHNIEAFRLASIHSWLHNRAFSTYIKTPPPLKSEDFSLNVNMCYKSDVNNYRLDFLATKPDDLPLHIPELKFDSMIVTIYSGIYGCGKTRLLKQLLSNVNHHVVVSPVKNLCDEYKEDGFKAYTQHTIFLKSFEGAVLVIDEAFTFYVDYILMLIAHVQPRRVYLMGDPGQIGAIDFSKAGDFDKYQRFTDVYSKVLNQVTNRCPQDIAYISRGLGYREAQSTVPISTSIYFVKGGLYDVSHIKGYYGPGPVYVFNRETAVINEISTIHREQGMSNYTTYFYIDVNAISSDYASMISHVTVAMSRHSNKLVVIGENSHFDYTLDYYGSNIHMNMAKYDMQVTDSLVPVSMLADVNAGLKNQVIPIKIIYNPISLPVYDIREVFTIIKRVFKIPAAFEDIFSVVNTRLDFGGTQKVLIKPEKMLEYIRPAVRGYMILPEASAARSQGSDSLTCVDAALRRHDRNIVRMSEEMAIQSAADMLNAMSEKFVKKLPDIKTIVTFANERNQKIYNSLNRKGKIFVQHLAQFRDDDSQRMHHLTQYLRSIDKKVMPRAEYDKLLDNKQAFYVRFFPKYQIKPDMKVDPFNKDKAPQGVSSYDKCVNVLFATFARQFAQVIQNFLKTEVIFAANMSDAELSATVGAVCKKHTKTFIEKFMLGDFTQFDSTQSLMAAYLMGFIYCCIGMPERLYELYIADCKNWTLSTDYLKLFGTLQMLSGKAETWIRNTWYNACVTALMYEFDFLNLALFTGDDSALNATHCRFKDTKWLVDRGLKLKNETSNYMEFAGKLLVGGCLVPDPFRRVIKFITKVYIDLEHYNETIKSLRNGFETYRSMRDIELAYETFPLYYRDGKHMAICPGSGDMKVILGFLHNEAMNPRSLKEMTLVNKPIYYEYMPFKPAIV
nr:nonstructural polyprotein [Hepelivirales sp.]